MSIAPAGDLYIGFLDPFVANLEDADRQPLRQDGRNHASPTRRSPRGPPWTRVGWCQFGAPDEVPKIKNRTAYEKGLTTLPDWRIACNFVGKGHRRRGVATAALDGALDLIARLGGGKVEGYSEAAGSVPAGFLFNGALSTYEQLGFVRDRKIGKHRWVVTKVVEPTS
jgi:GNAT superfamily N-acetyltransferase